MSIHSTGSPVRRALFAALGVFSVGLALIGVLIPGMPTTVFVLTASYLFARSSPTLEDRLQRNRWLGPSLRRFRADGGMPAKTKALALASMWTGIAISVYAVAAFTIVGQVVTLVLGVAGTATILFCVRTTAQVPTRP
jgi:uncharacterized membrane protein YbaN (DUF454 family)